MSNCAGCGGVVGHDCFNPQECEWITRDMAQQYSELRCDPNPPPCQGCSEITDRMTACIGACPGLTCQEDVEARAALWRQLVATHAVREAS